MMEMGTPVMLSCTEGADTLKAVEAIQTSALLT